MTTSNRQFGNISTIYMSTAKDQFFGFCATIILLLRISILFAYCKSTNFFTNGNCLNICLLCIEKLYGTFRSPIRKYFDDLYDYCAKPNFLSTAHHTIIFLLHISQLSVYCKSANYFTTGNRLNIWLLCIKKIVWQLQIVYLETFRRFVWLLRKAQLFGYCASIILLLRISLLFMYCKSANNFTTGNGLNNWLLCTEKLYDNFKSPI